MSGMVSVDECVVSDDDVAVVGERGTQRVESVRTMALSGLSANLWRSKSRAGPDSREAPEAKMTQDLPLLLREDKCVRHSLEVANM